jgi:hypothetical protein
MTRMPRRAPLAGRHARAGAALLAVAVILAATSVSVGLALPGLASSGWRSVVEVASGVLGFAAVWIALPLGAYLLITAGTPPPWRRIVAIAAAVMLPVLVAWSGVARSPFLILLALAGAVGGYAIIVLGLTEHRHDPVDRASVVVPVVVLGAANLLVVALGTLHLLVWNPLATVSELTLAEIFAALGARGGIDGGPLAWAIASTLVTAAAAVGALFGARRGMVTPHQVVTGGLLLIHGTSFFLWWAGFGLGLELADTFGTSGGDASPAGSLLALAGALCLAAAILLQLRLPSGTAEELADPDGPGETADEPGPDDGPQPVTPVTVTP